MGHSNAPMLFSAMALLMLPLVGLPSACLAALLLLVKRPIGTLRRNLAYACGGLTALLLLGSIPALLSLGADAAHQADQAERNLTLGAPREIGGLTFPAGSQLRVRGHTPERLVGGYVQQPTRIGGLLLIQSFKVGSDGTVESGQLAEPAQLGPLPCAAGGFDRDEGRFRCTLSDQADIAGVTLARGSYATVTPHTDGTPAWITGFLAAPAKLGGLTCGAGKVYFDINLTQCVLDADQPIEGIWLQGGVQTGLSSRSGWSLSSGALARPLTVLGVVLPRDTEIATLSMVQSDTLANQVGQGTAKFRLPQGTGLPILGGHAQGPVDIQFSDDRIQLSATQPPGSFTLGGRETTSASYDRAQARWQLGPDRNR